MRYNDLKILNDLFYGKFYESRILKISSIIQPLLISFFIMKYLFLLTSKQQ